MAGPWEKYQRTDGAASDAADQPSTGLPTWAQARAVNPSPGFPAPPSQNLTVRALRMKGVPDADIAAAINTPTTMRQLINHVYGADSAEAAAGTDALSSGRTQAAPPAPRLGQSKMPQAVQAPLGNPFAVYPNGILGVPGERYLKPLEAPDDGAQPASWSDLGSDAWHSFVSGLEDGAIGFAGTPGDHVRTTAPAVTDYVAHRLFGLDPAKHAFPAITDVVGDKLGIDPNMVNQFKNGVANAVDWLPTSNELRSRFEGVAGPLYEPKTATGHAVHTLGEYSSALLGAPELLAAKLIPKLGQEFVRSVPERLVTRVVAPAIGSEAAGDLPVGADYRPAARVIGAALAGAGAAASIRAAAKAPIGSGPGTPTPKSVRIAPFGFSIAMPNQSDPMASGLVSGALGGFREYGRQSRHRSWDDAY